MSDPFHFSFLKIERANQHLKELESVLEGCMGSVAQFTPAEIPSVMIEPGKFQINLGGFTMHGGSIGVPEITSAIIGDFLHNLRTSLDLMAVQLVMLNKQSERGVYFPFAKIPDEMENQIKSKNFTRAGDDAVKLLRELKPYKGGNSALYAIHDLDIEDKHRALIPVPNIGSVTSPTFTIIKTPSGMVQPQYVTDPHKPSHVEFLLPDGLGHLSGQRVIPALHDLMKTAAGVIETFKCLKRPAG